VTKTPLTQSPYSPSEELTPLSTATEVRPRDRTVGRDIITPASLTEAMNEFATHESDEDEDSGVTEIKQDSLKQELNQLTARCRIAEYDAEESLKKVALLTSENDLLAGELKEVNEELALARKRIDSLQQRLANSLTQHNNQQPQTIGSPAANSRNDFTPPSTNGMNAFERDARSRSDYGSDYGSTSGIPPSSGRRGLRTGVDDYADEGYHNGWGGGGVDSMQRRVSNAFSNRLSFDGGGGGVRGGSVPGDDFSASHISPNGGAGPIYREKDTVICKRLSDWLIKVANIVPTRAASYAVTLVQNGQASLRRLEKSLKKDPDYLLHLGFDDDDAEEIAEALSSESSTVAHTTRPSPEPQISNQMSHLSPPKQSNLPTRSGLPPRDRKSMSPPPHPSTSFMSHRNQNMSSDVSIRSFSSVPADFFADPEGMSPDKAFREARLARLQAQAQEAAELAQFASEDADRVAKTYRKGSLLRSNSGLSSAGGGNTIRRKNSSSSSSSSKKIVAQAHEKGNFPF
jgi:hypothetical protein